MKTLLFSAAAALLLGVPPARAEQELLGYWNLNLSTTRSAGTTGSLVAYYFGYGPEFMGYDTGTTVNLLPPSGAGEALLFAHFATIVGEGFVQIDGLDFSNHTSPTFSFAVRKSVVAELFSFLRIEYNTGSGWETAETLAEPGEAFALYSHTFTSGVLDGKSNVGLRLHFREVVDFAAALSVDNVQVRATAVPEPGVWALGAAAALAAIGLRRGRGLRD